MIDVPARTKPLTSDFHAGRAAVSLAVRKGCCKIFTAVFLGGFQ
jgi:hypothetical protein